MANFNKVKDNRPKNTSYEGGAVYAKAPIDEWVNMLFSSFLENGYYESAATQQMRFLELTDKIAVAYGYEFVAKCAVFARNELGMRSISQFTAAWLNDKSFENKRAFYRAFCHRPDDVAELFAAVDFLKSKRSHALIRGCGDYLSNISSYTLGKYKLNSRTYNMFDLINLTHATSSAINDYKTGFLAAPDTWEVKISTAETDEARDLEWVRLVQEHRLGYMALIRNLNNILDCKDYISEDWIKQYLIPQLMNKDAIHQSLIFPYRIYTTYKNLKVKNIAVIYALSEAFKMAMDNTPRLKGSSVIFLDVSGSMDNRISSNSNISLKEVGACFAVNIFLSNPDTTIIKFGSRAKKANLNLYNNVFALIEQLCDNEDCGYSTEIEPAFDLVSKDSYNRTFIISDMQVMDSRNYWTSAAATIYRKIFKNTPCYSFDLGNYHTQILGSTDNIHYITALNDQVFKFIGLLESGIDLFSYINNFSYC